MQIHYLNVDDFTIDTSYFKPYLARLNEQIETHSGVLNVVFVNNPYIQALNKTYRAKDKPTDVLSFNYKTEGRDFVSDLFGEVYVSVEMARAQASDHHHSLQDELIKLVVHGILHVHGYDHVEDEDYRDMFAIEKAVLGDIAGELLL